MTLAHNTSTPIPFWLDLTLVELRRWIAANNNVLAERKEGANGK